VTWAEEGTVVELPEFAIAENRLGRERGLSPVGLVLDELMGRGQTAFDVPRSVTVLTAEAMERFDIRSFEDLERAGPGTARINYFGIAGAPILRGAKAGTYFNGMLRAFQRNEMPVSFGSLERLDVVRGAAPAHFTPTPVGGFVNFVPRSPFFDARRSRAEVVVGASNEYRAHLDSGGPTAFGRRPAAWRATATVQHAGTPYDRVRHDFVSAYGAVNVRLAPGWLLSAGAELYDFRSNENAGWNRVTQELIDHGRYVIGEPPQLASAAWGGTVPRPLLEFPFSAFVQPALHALAVPGELARARIPAPLRGHLIDLNDPAQVAALYALRPEDQVPSFLRPNPASPDFAAQLALYEARRATAQAALNAVGATPQDAYVYTPAYFAAGGEVLTAPLSRRQVLADTRDFADSRNGLFFLDLENLRRADFTWKNQFLAEGLTTDKQSSYGYAIQTRQWLMANKLTFAAEWPALRSRALFGAEGRATFATVRQDFAAEPFSRRDLTRPEVSANTLVLAGSDRAPDGLNLWSASAGANIRSQLRQGAVFGVVNTAWNERLGTQISWRGEGVTYRTRLPRGIDRATPAIASAAERRDERTYTLLGVHPVWHVHRALNVYGTWQRGTAIDPAPGGAIYGAGNFSRAALDEVGAKFAPDRRWFAAVAAYRWTQSNYNPRDARAEPLRGRGLEAEFVWEPSERWSVMGSLTMQRQWVDAPALGFGAVARSPEQWALTAGLLTGAGNRTFANNPDLIYSGYPERLGRLGAVARLGNGWSASLGATWRDAYWLNFDRTLRLPAALLWDGGLTWEGGPWLLRLQGENLTNQRHFLGAAPSFSGNATVTPAPGLGGRATVRYRW
jgi:hypothetical protein